DGRGRVELVHRGIDHRVGDFSLVEQGAPVVEDAVGREVEHLGDAGAAFLVGLGYGDDVAELRVVLEPVAEKAPAPAGADNHKTYRLVHRINLRDRKFDCRLRMLASPTDEMVVEHTLRG